MLRKFFADGLAALVALAVLAPAIALAQSNPGLVTGQVPTAAQWNSYFSAKQDALGYIPVNKAGDVMAGKLTTSSSSAIRAGLSILPGTAPANPQNGDVWITPAGMFAEINGQVASLLSAGIVVGTTAISNGGSGNVLYDNGGIVGELSPTGSGNAVLANAPTLVTPTLGAALATTINGVTIPSATDTAALLAATQTLTNKTLTSPVISGGTIDNAVIGGTTPAAGSFTTLSANNASVTFSALGTGTVAGSVCQTAAGLLIKSSGSNCFGSGTANAAGNATGQVQYNSGGTGGSLAASAGFSFDGTSVASLGVAGTSVGGLKFNNATSGFIELEPPTGALGSAVLTLPDVTDTLVALAATQTLTNKSIAGSEINSGLVGASVGGTGVNNGSSTLTLAASLTTTGAGAPTLAFPATSKTYTYPVNTDTLAALGTAETWTGAQTFSANDLILKGSTSGTTTLNAAATAGSTVITLPGVTDTVAVLGTVDQVMSGGIHLTAFNIGTQSSGTYTVDCGNNPVQYLTDNGAFTLAAPSNDSSCLILVTMAASAGPITFNGFTVGASTGDPIVTANGDKFTISIWRINSVAGYRVAAMQ